MIRMTSLLLIFGVFVGCANQNDKWAWFKAGSTQQDFNMDDGQCRAQAFSIVGAPMIQRVIVMQNCMIGKGWEKQPIY